MFSYCCSRIATQRARTGVALIRTLGFRFSFCFVFCLSLFRSCFFSRCLTHCFIPWEEPRARQFRKCLIGVLLIVPEGDSMTTMIGSMATGRHVVVAIAQSLHPDRRHEVGLPGDQEGKGEILGLVWTFETSKPSLCVTTVPSRPRFLILPKWSTNSTNSGPNIQPYKPVGTILIQTTILSNKHF